MIGLDKPARTRGSSSLCDPDLLVIGLGYVGLPLAAEAARCGLTVVGYDPDHAVVSGLNVGRSHHLSSAAYVRSLRAHLSTADVRFRPAIMTTVMLADGQHVLRVEVTAPSPLGVFGPQSSP